MTNYEYLKDLEGLGKLKPLFKKGIVSLTVYNYFTFYECYLYELKRTTSKMDAIENVCESCKINYQVIYRAIKLMAKRA